MPSVIHVLWSAEVGGSQRAVYLLAVHQARMRPGSVAVGLGTARGHYRQALASAGIPVVDFGMGGAADVAAAVRARGVLNDFPIHHFHACEPALMAASASVARARRVYTHRGGMSDYRPRRALRYRIAAPLVRRFDAVTGTAQAAAAVERLFGIPARRVVPTFNGVDPGLFKLRSDPQRLRVGYGVSPDTVLIGTAANLRAWKRVDWLIDATARLPPGPWEVWVLGDGEDRARLEALAAASPAAPRIRFHGIQPDIADWLRALDVFVLPSGPDESFGNAVVEAMACGLPVVVSADCPAHLEHVTDGRTGFVVSDPAGTAACLARLLADPELGRRVGRAAEALVRERYTMSRVVERFEDVYAGLYAPGHDRRQVAA